MREILIKAMKSLMLAACIALAGCATSGTKIDQSNLDRISVGNTDKTQMVAMFGKPVAQSFGSDGKLQLSWVYVRVASFSLKADVQNLVVLFDQKDKVEKFNLVDSTK